MGSDVKVFKFIIRVNFISFLLVPLFRLFFYNSIYKAPNDAYGLSDIIILLLWFWFMFVAIISIIFIITVIRRKEHVKKNVGLLFFCIVLVLVINPLQTIAAQFSI